MQAVGVMAGERIRVSGDQPLERLSDPVVLREKGSAGRQYCQSDYKAKLGKRSPDE
jgi:hypothetical protein